MARMGHAVCGRKQRCQARGRVVEIGAGTGLNIGHYAGAADEVILTEPVPAMYRRARHRAEGQDAMTSSRVASDSPCGGNPAATRVLTATGVSPSSS
jgi:protein-L-isoaspartate O-methyltransferase